MATYIVISATGGPESCAMHITRELRGFLTKKCGWQGGQQRNFQYELYEKTKRSRENRMLGISNTRNNRLSDVKSCPWTCRRSVRQFTSHCTLVCLHTGRRQGIEVATE
jgi:hypothetical protein